MPSKSNIFGDLPKKPIKQTVEDNRLVERVERENLYPFKRGSFETYEDFRKRLTDNFQYNIGIGTVTLNDTNYDVETKKFFLNTQYQKWFQQLCSLETSNRFYIEIEPSEAQSLYYDYESYELVAQFEVDCECGITVNIDKKVKILLKKMWLIAKAKHIINHNGFKNLVWDTHEPKSISFQEYFKTVHTDKLCNSFILMKKSKEKQEKTKQQKALKEECDLWEKSFQENTLESYRLYLDKSEQYIYYTKAINQYIFLLKTEFSTSAIVYFFSVTIWLLIGLLNVDNYFSSYLIFWYIGIGILFSIFLLLSIVSLVQKIYPNFFIKKYQKKMKNLEYIKVKK